MFFASREREEGEIGVAFDVVEARPIMLPSLELAQETCALDADFLHVACCLSRLCCVCVYSSAR